MKNLFIVFACITLLAGAIPLPEIEVTHDNGDTGDSEPEFFTPCENPLCYVRLHCLSVDKVVK